MMCRHLILLLFFALFASSLAGSWDQRRFPRATAKDTKDTKTKDESEVERFKNDFKQFIEDSLKKKIQETQEAFEEWKEILDEKADNFTEAVNGFKEKLAEPLEESKRWWNETRDVFRKKINEWREKQAQEKAEQEKAKQEKKDKWKKKQEELKNEWQAQLKERLDQGILNAIEDFLEKKLQEELEERDKKAKASTAAPHHAHHTSTPPHERDPATANGTAEKATPAGRAAFLDELTGASTWQTMAWILLILCVVLAAGLIVLVIFQVMSRKREYERLDGHNDHHNQHGHPDPIFVPASTAPKTQTSDLSQQF